MSIYIHIQQVHHQLHHNRQFLFRKGRTSQYRTFGHPTRTSAGNRRRRNPDHPRCWVRPGTTRRRCRGGCGWTSACWSETSRCPRRRDRWFRSRLARCGAWSNLVFFCEKVKKFHKRLDTKLVKIWYLNRTLEKMITDWKLNLKSRCLHKNKGGFKTFLIIRRKKMLLSS